jgi:hypothetical protein
MLDSRNKILKAGDVLYLYSSFMGELSHQQKLSGDKKSKKHSRKEKGVILQGISSL